MTRSRAKTDAGADVSVCKNNKPIAKIPGKPSSRQTLFIRLIVLLMAVTFGLLHWLQVSQMHENDLFFSHLSSAERELTFRTEMGFYYSYFKQMILAPNFTEAWKSLLADTRSEVPRCLPSITPNGSSTDTTVAPGNRSCPELNAMQRFNLYPELMLASAYRVFRSLGLLHTDCYRVSRDLPRDPIALVVNPGLFAQAIHNTSVQMLADQTLGAVGDSVLSCTGLAEPAYFYTGFVFALAGLNLVGLCLSGWLLANLGSSSLGHSGWLPVWGALLPALAYFANHREATRVQWTPPLRESFAYPFFVLQQTFLLFILSGDLSSPVSTFQALTYCSLLLGFQLPWQFAQFALCTQVASLFAACCLATAIHACAGMRIAARVEWLVRLVRRVRATVLVHLIALLVSYVLQFGNALLLSSVYLPGVVGCWVGLSVLLRRLDTAGAGGVDRSTDSTREIKSNCLPALGGRLAQLLNLIVLPFSVTLGITATLFALLNAGLGVEQHDGGHIVDMLREKFQLGGRFHTFHTRLYTCAAEFDFIGWNSLEQPFRTGLLPTAMLLAVVVLGSACVRLLRFTQQPNQPSPTATSAQSTNESKDQVNLMLLDFVSLFVVIQLLFFTLMAVLIMRLKLFWTPQLCLTLALLAQPIRWRSVYQSVSAWWVSHHRARAAPKTDRGRVTPPPPEPPASIAHVLLVVLFAYMCAQGARNLQAELRIRGQFSAFSEEVLIDWFSSLPPPPQGSSTPWVISGPMSTLGNLRLMLPAAAPYPSPQPVDMEPATVAGFAFTNHPHYENAELRRRTVLALAVYSRKSVLEVWQIYRYQLQTNFVIFDPRACRSRNGCSSPELYDLVEPHLADRVSLCEALLAPDVTDHGLVPPAWKPYFDVVYVDFLTGTVVLYVRPVIRT